jgi:hypothetical protein
MGIVEFAELQRGKINEAKNKMKKDKNAFNKSQTPLTMRHT